MFISWYAAHIKHLVSGQCPSNHILEEQVCGNKAKCPDVVNSLVWQLWEHWACHTWRDVSTCCVRGSLLHRNIDQVPTLILYKMGIREALVCLAEVFVPGAARLRIKYV